MTIEQQEPDAEEGMAVPSEPMNEDDALLDEPEEDEDSEEGEDAPPAEPNE